MNARDVKNKLYPRHPGSGDQMPDPWTIIEEWRGIDLLAISAWSSADNYARVGYEVKVSRADMRSELLNPAKRGRNVEWCNEFYFAVPAGLLTDDELAFDEPEWDEADWHGERCDGLYGQRCYPLRARRKTHYVRVPIPSTDWPRHDHVPCPTCGGKGVLAKSRVEREAPTLWVPRDVGLIVVDGRGSRVVKPSPRRKQVPTLSAGELGQFVRWISMRPDPRHAVDRSLRSVAAA